MIIRVFILTSLSIFDSETKTKTAKKPNMKLKAFTITSIAVEQPNGSISCHVISREKAMLQGNKILISPQVKQEKDMKVFHIHLLVESFCIGFQK